MENQYLNEEKYQKTKRKITIVAILVLIIGLLVGGGLIATGLKKNKEAKLNTEQIASIQSEIDDYQLQLSSLKAKQNQEVKANGFSENYYNLDNQIDKLEDQIDALEDSLEQDTGYLFVFYMFGGFIIFVTLVISFAIYFNTKGRELAAFYTQQQIPVVQETINEMTPTIGKAAKELTNDMTPTIGNVAKEVAKGIKEGLEDKE